MPPLRTAVTQGPYAESAEQGCDGVEAVLEACEAMADVHVHLLAAPVLPCLSIPRTLTRHRDDRLTDEEDEMTQSMSQYVVLLPGDEAEWEAAPEERRQSTYAQHREFAKLLEERGHRVTGGAELAHSRETKLLRTAADGTQTVTDGPFAETVEQLTGFYLIDSPDLDDLLEVCKVLGKGEGVIEVREMKGGTSS